MSNQLSQEYIDHNTTLLIEASEHGDIAEVERLIPISDPKAQDSNALRWAARNGHLEIVALLIQTSEPKARDSAALRGAAMNGHTETVQLLIPVSDPKANDSWALLWAVCNGHTECVKLLIPVSDYLKVEQEIMAKNRDTTFLRQHIDEYEALLQKERLTHQLNNSVEHTQHSSVKRKM